VLEAHLDRGGHVSRGGGLDDHLAAPLEVRAEQRRDRAVVLQALARLEAATEEAILL
jgi:hypothetical protein